MAAQFVLGIGHLVGRHLVVEDGVVGVVLVHPFVGVEPIIEHLISQGKHEEAHQLTLLAGMRTSGRMTLREYYQNEKRVRQEMQTFFSEVPMRQIVKLGENWSARWMANRILRITDENGLLVFQRFEIHYTEDGRPVTLPVEIKSSRILDKYTRASHWTVLTVRHLQ